MKKKNRASHTKKENEKLNSKVGKVFTYEELKNTFKKRQNTKVIVN